MDKKNENGTATIYDRNISLDLLRVFASIMVVMLHVSAFNWYSLAPSQSEWMGMNFFDSMTRSAVPLFFMLNGAFVLKKDIAVKMLYLKKIIPLCGIYFVWSFLYAVDSIGIEIENLSVSGLIEIIRVTTESHYHLWFIPTLIGIYMLQPVLRAIVSYREGVNIRYLLIIFLLFGITIPTVVLFLEGGMIASLITRIPVELMGYSCYVVLGYYLANMDNRKKKPYMMLLMFLATGILSSTISQIDALRKQTPSGILYGNFTLTTFLEAIFLFLCFKNMNLESIPSKVRRFICNISSLTLGVYLLHPFIMSQFASRFQFHSLFHTNTFLTIPVVTVVISMTCMLVTFIMVKIPIVKKLWKY